MPITVTCAACGQSYPIRDDMAGKRVRCRCGQAIAVPEGGGFYNFMDELPPQASLEAGPADSPRRSQRQLSAYSRRKPAAKSEWLIPAIAISAVVIPCILVVGCVVIVAGSRRMAEPVASGWNDLGSESFVASGPPSSAEAELQRIRNSGEPISFADLDAYYPAPPADQDVTQLWLTGIAPLDSPQFKVNANGLSFVSDGPERIPWPGESWEQLSAAEKLLAADARVTELAKTWNANRDYPITFLIVPPVNACANAASRIEAERDAARVAVAVERFYRREARLPAKLDELAPRYLASPPIDPCDGKPLRYRVEPTGYLIYSVGPDGVDDGGRPAPIGKEGDAVVRIRRK